MVFLKEFFEKNNFEKIHRQQKRVKKFSGGKELRWVFFSFFCRFAGNADNYGMVMTAARHYWNASCPLLSQPIERELLREPIRIILQCITDTAEKLKKKEV